MKKILFVGIAIIAVFVAAFLLMKFTPSEAAGFGKMETSAVQINNITLEVKIADSQDEWAAGFQNIPAEVIEKSAILFVFPDAEIRTFHMRNVAAELDIAFADSDGIIFQVLRMVPGDALYVSSAPAMYTIETRAGFFSEHNITAGDKITF